MVAIFIGASFFLRSRIARSRGPVPSFKSARISSSSESQVEGSPVEGSLVEGAELEKYEANGRH